MNTQTAKHCVKMIGMIIVSVLVSIALFNIIMDPYDIFGTLAKKRPLYLVDKSYLTKAVGLIHNRRDTMIIGSSIVDHAFKVSGSMTAFYEDDFDQNSKKLQSHIRPQVSIFNAGIRGGGLNDIYHYIQHAYKNNPQLKHIIIGLEWNLFTYAKRASVTMPKVAPLEKTYVPLSFYANHMLTWRVTYDSTQTLLYLVKKRMYAFHMMLKQHDIDMVTNIKLIHTSMKNLYDQLSARYLHRYNSEVISSNDIEQHLIQGQNPHETASLLFSIWAISAVKANLETIGSDSILNPEAFETMRQIVAFSKKNNISLDVYVSPQHAAYWETANKHGLQSYIDQWLKQLAQITPYWEFSKKIDFSPSVDHYFDTDALHFNYKAGEIILVSILNGHGKLSAGVNYITPINIDTALNERHQAALLWLKNNRYMSAILAHPNFIKSEQVKGELDKVISVEYKPTFMDYHIIKFMGQFIALPVNKAPYDFRLLFTGKYAAVITGSSVEDLVEKIKRNNVALGSVRPSV